MNFPLSGRRNQSGTQPGRRQFRKRENFGGSPARLTERPFFLQPVAFSGSVNALSTRSFLFRDIMHSGSQGRFFWSGLIVLLGLPFFEASAPAARAGCGDYVHFKTSPTAAPSSIPPQTERLPPVSPPCQGPGCSHQQPPLAPLPAPAPSEPGEQWAWVLSLAPPICSPLSGRIARLPGAVLPALGEDIFHPPRS